MISNYCSLIILLVPRKYRLCEINSVFQENKTVTQTRAPTRSLEKSMDYKPLGCDIPLDISKKSHQKCWEDFDLTSYRFYLQGEGFQLQLQITVYFVQQKHYSVCNSAKNLNKKKKFFSSLGFSQGVCHKNKQDSNAPDFHV